MPSKPLFAKVTLTLVPAPTKRNSSGSTAIGSTLTARPASPVSVVLLGRTTVKNAWLLASVPTVPIV